MRASIVIAVLAAACGSAAAQQVYRCGSSYSQHACPGATPVAMTTDASAPSEAARAAAAAKTDAKRADAMERARLAQEAKAPKAIVMAGAPEASAAPAAKPAKLQKGGKLEQFTAVSPRPPKEKKKK
jgi:hypothetical protein